MSSPGGAENRERRVGCQCLRGTENEGERHSARSSLESHPKGNSTGCAGGHILACLSHRWSVLGLPKVPDTKFKRQSQSGAARVRPNGPKGSSGRPAVSFIPPEAAAPGGVSRTGSRPAEPASPNVSCIGRVKLKKKEPRKWAEPRDLGKLLRMKRFFLAGDRTEPARAPAPAPAPAPGPAQPLARFASVRRPAAFFEEDPEQNRADFEDSGICGQGLDEMKNPECGSVVSWEDDGESQSQASEESTVARSCSGLLNKTCVSDEQPLPVGTAEQQHPPENSLWKRRSVGPIKPLDLANSARGNGLRKPSTV